MAPARVFERRDWIMVGDTTSRRTPRRSFIVFLQSVLIVCWTTLTIAVAVLVCLFVDMSNWRPIGEPRPSTGQHVHSAIIGGGIGLGLLGSTALAFAVGWCKRKDARPPAGAGSAPRRS